jgi:prepilin-type N-terminal cleavage/methylation domain-containing protein
VAFDKTSYWNMKRNHLDKYGFTLIELMIVVSLTIVMSTILVGNFFHSLASGKDAKRKSDIKEIQTALEQYYSACGNSYPVFAGGIIPTAIFCPNPSIMINKAVPQDPSVISPYYCPNPVATNCTRDLYTICATMEVAPTRTFCVTNMQ